MAGGSSMMRSGLVLPFTGHSISLISQKWGSISGRISGRSSISKLQHFLLKARHASAATPPPATCPPKLINRLQDESGVSRRNAHSAYYAVCRQWQAGRINDKIFLAREVIEYVCNHLGRNPSRPIVSKPFVTIVPIPQIPCSQAPVKRLESLQIVFPLQGNRPDERLPAKLLARCIVDVSIHAPAWGATSFKIV